jgi:hypothetical protein
MGAKAPSQEFCLSGWQSDMLGNGRRLTQFAGTGKHEIRIPKLEASPYGH